MEDVNNDPGKDHDMSTIKATIKGSTAGGKAYFVTYDNWPSNLEVTSYPTPSLPFPSTDEAFYSRMVAGTAPHRSEFGLPTFLAELKDFPGLLRDGFRFSEWVLENSDAFWDPDRRRWKKPSKPLSPQKVLEAFGFAQKSSILYTRRLAKASLAIQFGFVPFLSDISKAVGVSQQIEARRKEFLSTSKRGILKRRWNANTPIELETQLIPLMIEEQGEHFGTVVLDVSGRKWGTIQWSPTPNTLLPKNDAELLAILTGLNAGGMLLAAWEAMPWSWMIDYFTNVGDIISATLNGAQYTVRGCVHTEVKLTAKHGPHSRVALPFIDHHLTSGELTRVHYNRKCFNGMPELSVMGDLLRPQQLSILASLTAVKA